MTKRSIKSSGMAAPMAMSRQGSGFTIVEILVCLAIVCLLATIAIPNFLRAHTAADVAAARYDLKQLKTGVDAYKSDIGDYPWQNPDAAARRTQAGSLYTLERLTTPIAYVDGSANFVDPFSPQGWYYGQTLENISARAGDITVRDYRYNARSASGASVWNKIQVGEPSWFFLESSGPDQYFNLTAIALDGVEDNETSRGFLLKTIYDPTNGTVSRGSIWVQGGNPQGYGTSMAWAINQQSSSHVGEWRKY